MVADPRATLRTRRWDERSLRRPRQGRGRVRAARGRSARRAV